MERFLKDIEKVRAEVARRYTEKFGEKGMFATKEEVRALRQLAALLEGVFGPCANINFGGEGE